MPPKKTKTPPKLNIVQTFNSSFYGPSFYASIPKRTFGQALKYFLLLTLVYVLFIGGTLIIALFGEVNFKLDLETMETAVKNVYPEELVITIEDGEASTNMDEPIFLDFPRGEVMTKVLNSVDEETDYSIEHMAVLDTTQEFGVQQLKAYKSLFWMNRDSVFFYNPSENKVEGFELSEVNNIQITRTTVDGFMEVLFNKMKSFVPMMVVMAFLGAYIGLVILGMLYVLFLAVLLLIVGAILNVKLNYGQSYRMGLYGMTIAYVANILIDVLNIWVPFRGFPFMITLIILAFATLNISQGKDQWEKEAAK